MKVAGLIIVACALAAACAEAGGNPAGGEFTDAGTQATTIPEVLSKCDGTGTKWSELYHDVFGPTGKPGSCSFRSSCHGTAGTEAVQRGITCFDQAGCRQSMITTFSLTSVEYRTAPETAPMFGIIRTRDPASGKVAGIMPREPGGFVFPETCLARIRTWIAEGVPKDPKDD